MSGHEHAEPVISRPILITVMLMVTATVIGAAWSSYTKGDSLDLPESTVLVARDLVFKDRDDGAVVVSEAGQQVLVFEAGSGGFIRGTLRALARQRQLGNIGSEEPFRLVHWADGRLSLIDPATKGRIEINAFGRDNLDAFAEILDAPRAETLQVNALETSAGPGDAALQQSAAQGASPDPRQSDRAGDEQENEA